MIIKVETITLTVTINEFDDIRKAISLAAVNDDYSPEFRKRLEAIVTDIAQENII